MSGMSVPATRIRATAIPLLVALVCTGLPAGSWAQRLVGQFQIHGSPQSLWIKPDGLRIIYLFPGRCIGQLDTRTGECVTLFDFHRSTDQSWDSNLLVDTRGNWFAASSADTLFVLAAPVGPVLCRIQCAGSDFLSIARSPSGDRIAGSGRGFKGFGIWDTWKGRLLRMCATAEGSPAYLDWSPRGDLIAISGFHEHGKVVITLWDAAQGVRVGVLGGAGDRNFFPRFTPDGRRIIATIRDKGLVAWDTSTRRVVWRSRSGAPRMFQALAFSPDGHLFLAPGPGGDVSLASCATGRVVRHWTAYANGGVYSAAFYPDGHRVATASAAGILKVWDIGADLSKRP
jgi:WD40 repeat protein